MARGLAAGLEAHPLPWPQAPTHARLRFNEDLGTRAGWYPPAEGAPLALAPALWWGCRASAGPAALGLTAWWHEPGAAEGPHPNAQSLRAAQAAAVRGRWCTVHVLAEAVRLLGPADNAGAPSQVPHAKALQQLAVSLGAPEELPCAVGAVDSWLLGQAQLELSSTRALQLFSCSVLACMCCWGDSILASSAPPAAPLIAGEQAADPGLDACSAALVALLQSTMSALLGQLGGGTAGGGAPLVAGGLLAQWTHMVAEPLTWLVAGLEVGGDGG